MQRPSLASYWRLEGAVLLAVGCPYGEAVPALGRLVSKSLPEKSRRPPLAALAMHAL